MENSWSKSRDGRTFFQARGQGDWLVAARSPRLRHPWKNWGRRDSTLLSVYVTSESHEMRMRVADQCAYNIVSEFCLFSRVIFNIITLFLIVYYQGRKVSSSFLWLTSFFFHSLVVFLLTCSMKLPHQQPMLPTPPTKARTKESHALIVPFLPSPSFFFFLYHLRWILSPTRMRMLCNSFVPDWWQDRIVIKLQLAGKSRLILCLFSNFCVFSFNIR